MNILVVNPSVDLYGANRILLTVLQKLSMEHNIILYLPAEGPFAEYIRKNNLDIQIIVRDRLPLIGRKLNTIPGIIETVNNFRLSYFFFKRELKRHKIDFVYVNTLAGFPMIKLFNFLNKKILVHVHELLEKPKLVTGIINKYSIKWADRIICVSEPVRQNLLLHTNKETGDKKITVILNGIEDRFHPVQRIEDGKVIITLIGRITKEKGIWFFLDAIRLLPVDIAAKCEFRILGGPAPGREDLIKQLDADIDAHEYHNHIIFIPFKENVTPFLNETDILVVPSLMRDPFPTTILEGLSAGKPVIATNTGGAVQSIQSNKDGILIEAGDVKSFSAHLLTLITTPSLRSELGSNARQSFLRKFQVSTFQNAITGDINTNFNR